MTTYRIKGIEVQFPHEAYDCQVSKPCFSVSSEICNVQDPELDRLLADILHGECHHRTAGGDDRLNFCNLPLEAVRTIITIILKMRDSL